MKCIFLMCSKRPVECTQQIISSDGSMYIVFWSNKMLTYGVKMEKKKK